MSVLYFLLLVGVLVVIHELGHFAAAKLLDVKVLRFSFGYGRPLVRAKLRRDRVPDRGVPARRLRAHPRDRGRRRPTKADAGRSFASRPLWQRLVIVLAGPAANLVLPVVIYFVFFAGHTMLPAGVIGDVLDGGAAARAGHRARRSRARDRRPRRSLLGRDRARRAARRRARSCTCACRATARSSSATSRRSRRPCASATAGCHRQGRVGITHAPFVPLVGVIDGAVAGGARGPAHRRSDHQRRRPAGPQLERRASASSARSRGASSIVYFRGTELPGVPQIQLLSPGFADLVPETQIDQTLKRHDVHRPRARGDVRRARRSGLARRQRGARARRSRRRARRQAGRRTGSISISACRPIRTRRTS